MTVFGLLKGVAPFGLPKLFTFYYYDLEVAVRRNTARAFLASLLGVILALVAAVMPASAATPAAVGDLPAITFEPLAPSCGTTFNVRATVDGPDPVEVMVIRQGDNDAQSDSVTLQPGSQDRSFTFTPNGDASYTIEVWDTTGTVLFNWYMPVECAQPNAMLYCYNGELRMYGSVDAYNDTVVRSFTVKLNGNTFYGPVDTVPGDAISFDELVTGLTPGNAYTLDLLVDGRVISNVRTGESTGTVPSCQAPIVKVSITGKVIVDSTIKCNVAVTAYNPGGAYVNQGWLFNGKPREGVNGTTLKVTKAMYGQTIVCTASAEDDYGNFAYATSASYKVGLGVAPVAKTKPTLTGTAKVGKTMKLKSVGVWSPKLTSYKCQVLVKTKTGKIIARTTVKTSTTCAYKLKSADKGKRLVIRVYAVLPYHVTGKALTAYSAVIK